MADKQTKSNKTTLKQDVLTLCLHIAVIVGIVVIIFVFVFGLHVQSGLDMSPNINDRGILFFYRLKTVYPQNTAVVYTHDGKTYVGRIVARGGDAVAIIDKGLTVNSYRQEDNKSTGETLAIKGGPSYPVKLKSDEVFILGDNREKAADSRAFGAIKLKDVKGEVVIVIRRRDV